MEPRCRVGLEGTRLVNLRFRELLSKQIASSQAAFQAQILPLLRELRPGSRPATTDHGPESNPTVPVATEDATTPTTNTPIQRFNSQLIEPLSPQASYHEFLDWRQQWNNLCLLSQLP